MQKRITIGRFFYLLPVLLIVIGVALKILGHTGWEILFISSAAALGVHLLVGFFQKKEAGS